MPLLPLRHARGVAVLRSRRRRQAQLRRGLGSSRSPHLSLLACIRAGSESGPTLRLSCSWASRRVRCAVIVVASKSRIPVEIVKSQYSYLSFDYDGWLLKEGDERQVRLAMDTLEPVIADKDKQVVDVRHKFARKLYAREYRWEPSPEIEASIHKTIFG
jgi:hypothetical protein